MSTFLPISINITNRQVLIIGGGKVALHKVQLLKRFTSNFKVIAPHILDELKRIKGVVLEEREYVEEDLRGYLLVYATTNNHELNHQIGLDAKKYGCLVNVADNPKLSDFVSPAIFKQDEMTVAVGSNGKDVKASIHLRNIIKGFLEENTNSMN